MFASKKKKLTSVLAILGLLVVSTAAYAYWTSGGSGTGSGTAGNVANLSVKQSTVLSAMYPGDTAQPLSGSFDNPNAGSAYVGTVTASIASVTKATNAPSGTCDASDFTLAGAAMTVNQDVAPGTSKGSWNGASIKFNNKASNQDACKGAIVNLAYAIS